MSCGNCDCKKTPGVHPLDKGVSMGELTSFAELMDAVFGPRATGCGVVREPLPPLKDPAGAAAMDSAAAAADSVAASRATERPAAEGFDLRVVMRSALSPADFQAWCRGQVHAMLMQYAAAKTKDAASEALSEAYYFMYELS